MNKRYAILFFAALTFVASRAQDPQFSQFYAVPTYISPAFAGTSLQSRFGLAYRNQWPSIPGAFVTYNFAFDHYMKNLNSGIGILATHDKAGSGGMRYTSIAAQYAYEIELKRKTFIRPALQVGYVSHAVDYTKLVFGDQLLNGSDVGSLDAYQGEGVSYMDIGAGILYFTPDYWLGASVHHLNEPNQSLLGAEASIPRKLSVHGGYRHRIKTPLIREKGQFVVAAFNYRAQEKFDQMDIGAYYEVNPFSIGLWYRGIPMFKAYKPGYGNNDAVAVSFGYQVNDLRIGYSYDLTSSKLISSTGGAHEITLVYEIADRRRKKSVVKRRVVPCAKF